MSSQLFRVACVSTVIAAAVACATSPDEETLAPSTELGDGGTSVSDAAVMTDAPAVPDVPDVDAARPTCSEAGWCITPLPDSDLTLQDIWPLPNHAFALASSDSRGTQILEWRRSGNQWSYVDDDARIGVPLASNVWSPNENEVYYAFRDSGAAPGAGGFRGYVNHGRRPQPPETAWSWTRHSFDCDVVDLPRVLGTSADDVYVTFCKKIYRLKADDGDAGPDGGTSPWIPDYIDNDLTNPVTFDGATGTGGDDVWFVGRRGSGRQGPCAVVIRKTSTGYQPIVDGVPQRGGCGARAGLPRIAATFTAWSALANGRFVAVLAGVLGGVSNDLVKIAASNDGDYAIDFVGSSYSSMPVTFTGVWGASEDDLWFLASRGQSGVVVRGANIWNDGGTFQYSTLVLNGAPNTQRLSTIRGTSNNNLWAVGVDRAFHKTSP